MSTTINGTTGIQSPSLTLSAPLGESSGGTNQVTVLTAVKGALNAGGSAPVYGCRAW